MKNIFAVLSLILIFSCKKENAKIAEKPALQNQKVQQNAKTESKEIKLETFGFPSEVEGCSCYFAVNRQEFVKQNYIFVDDYQRKAFLKINGELVNFNYKKNNENLPGKTLNIEAENGDFKFKIKADRVEDGEMETALYKGTLTVERKDGAKTETPIYGECGC